MSLFKQEIKAVVSTKKSDLFIEAALFISMPENWAGAEIILKWVNVKSTINDIQRRKAIYYAILREY